MRRFVPLLLLALLTVLAGATTLVSWNQSRHHDNLIEMNITCTKAIGQRPDALVVACADANQKLSSLHWYAWGDQTAYATGRAEWNDCAPTCAAGHWKSEPIDVSVWRIRGFLYTRITTSDPRFFPPDSVLQNYHSAG